MIELTALESILQLFHLQAHWKEKNEMIYHQQFNNVKTVIINDQVFNSYNNNHTYSKQDSLQLSLKDWAVAHSSWKSLDELTIATPQ